MICFPNAKINLGLNIIRKRSDGYHDLETVFYPVPLKDALEIVEGEVPFFRQTGIPIAGDPEKNLVMKALNLLKENYAVPALEVYLQKEIPFGAGLGGGSADAAFMLKLVNEYCGLGISPAELECLAARLGADCPFFICNKPVFASGTGTVFEAINLSLSGWWFCLVKPDIHVSTPEAYRMITPALPVVSLKKIIRQPVEEWRKVMINDFEKPVFASYPEIGRIRDLLYEAGAVYAAMSGSGSSVFGLFKEAVSIKEQFPDQYVREGYLS